jgi:hypothetical protein
LNAKKATSLSSFGRMKFFLRSCPKTLILKKMTKCRV